MKHVESFAALLLWDSSALSGFGVLMLVLMLVLLPTPICAQDSQFLFDANGNFLLQTAETITLPHILGQPQNEVIVPGEPASFSVVAADTRGLNYQWRFNGANIGGATGDALVLQNVGATNEGQYSVVLVNSSGSVTSAPAMLWWDGNGNGMADSWELSYFGNLTNNPTADFDGDGVSNLQEFLDGTNPTNGTSVRYRLTLLADGGSVTIIPSQASYTNGQMIRLTASPTGAFDAWTGDVVTRSNPLTLIMTTNLTVFSHFMPVNITWTNVAGGDWNNAANWSPNLVPSPIDNAFDNSQSITLNSNADCGGLIFTASSAGPSLTGSGTLTLHGTSIWSSGTMSGTGRTVIAPGGTVTITSQGLILTTRVLENGGTIVWTNSGPVYLGSGAVITNRAGALFDAQAAANIFYESGAACRFDNAGTFREEFNPGTTAFGIGVPFNNYGIVDLHSGALLCNDAFINNGMVTLASGTTNRLTAGGSVSGSFSAQAGALVDWTGGTYLLNSGALLYGSGTYQISSGEVTFNTDVPVQNLNVAGALDGTGTVTISNTMNWSDGSMSGSGRTFIAPGGLLNLNAPGTMFLTTRALENQGTIVWTNSGLIDLGSGALITNDPSALFDVQNAAVIAFQSGAATRFDNAGTFRKELNAGTTTFGGGVPLNNYGIVDLHSGALQCNDVFVNNGMVTLASGTTNWLGGGGSASGSFTAQSGALVDWTGGTYTLNSGTQLNGNGIYRNASATLACNLDFSLQNFDLSGTLAGTGAMTVNGLMNWTSGSMSGTGRTIIAPGALLNLNASGTLFLTTRLLENGGTTIWTNTGLIAVGSGATITNRAGALFDAQNAETLLFLSGGACRFDNAGTFRKELNLGTTIFSGGMPLNNYGTLDIQAGSVLANGGYTCTANSTLNCALGGTTAGTNYGQLTIGGAVALSGSLSVNLANRYLPTTNDSFTVLAASTCSGAFAGFSYPSNLVAMQLSNTASSVVVRVTAVTAPSPPFSLSASPSGTNLLLTWMAILNTSYRLEFNPSLSTSNWNAVPGDVTALSNTASKLDPMTASNRFYRVRVLP